jgi:hypothetical protein
VRASVLLSRTARRRLEDFMDYSYRLSRSTRSIAPVLAMAALSMGCASLPKTGAQDSGQALYVDVTSENVQYVAKVKTGDVVHKDASGNVIGTSEAYEDKMMSYNITRWAAFQGEDKLDDEDFFRIAGDNQAADQIHNYRAAGVSMNRIGWIMAAVGGGVILGGIVLYATVKKTEQTTEYDPVTMMNKTVDTKVANHVPGLYVTLAGVLVGGIGVSVAIAGKGRTTREHPIDDPRRAKRDERRYNKDHGVKPITGEERRSKKRGDDEE